MTKIKDIIPCIYTNPAQSLLELLTSPYPKGMGIPVSKIDSSSFLKIAECFRNKKEVEYIFEVDRMTWWWIPLMYDMLEKGKLKLNIIHPDGLIQLEFLTEEEEKVLEVRLNEEKA